MEEFADAKEDESKKILHTYPLVQVSIFSEPRSVWLFSTDRYLLTHGAGGIVCH